MNTSKRNCDRFSEIEVILRCDPGERGIAGLFLSGELEASCRSLLDAKRVVIFTGFFIPSAGRLETDGPPGALALRDALHKRGVEVRFVFDRACSSLVYAGLEPYWIDGPKLENQLREFAPTHLIAIERLGRAADGKYYTMRAIDNSADTAPLDRFFFERPTAECATIGVGDGGNEIGMGKVHDRVVETVKNGATIASTVVTDHLIVAGVSNWGAWGIAAGLSILSGVNLLPTDAEAEEHLARVVAAGAVDGVSGKQNCLSVDGFDCDEHVEILRRLRAVVERGLTDF